MAARKLLVAPLTLILALSRPAFYLLIYYTHHIVALTATLPPLPRTMTQPLLCRLSFAKRRTRPPPLKRPMVKLLVLILRHFLLVMARNTLRLTARKQAKPPPSKELVLLAKEYLQVTSLTKDKLSKDKSFRVNNKYERTTTHKPIQNTTKGNTPTKCLATVPLTLTSTSTPGPTLPLIPFTE